MADPKLPGIYAIRNTANGKLYVGSAKNIGARWRVHRCQLAGGKHHSPYLCRSWLKHGPTAFVFEVLEPVASFTDLIPREQFWIDALNSVVPNGYNVVPKAGSCLGAIRGAPSQAHRDAVSRGNKGKIVSAETRARLSAALKGNEKHKLSLRGLRRSAATRAKIGASKKGTTHTPETKVKMRIAKLGVRRTQEAVAKTALAHVGLKRSEETRKRMSAAQSGRRHSDAARANMREGWKKRKAGQSQRIEMMQFTLSFSPTHSTE